MFAGSLSNRSLWTPERISTALWLDAADSSTITTVSGGVSEWRDKSGNVRHATQGTSTSRPAWSASSFNGKPGLFFDGIDNWLTLGLPLLTPTGTHSIFAVGRTTTTNATPTGRALISQYASGVAGRTWLSLSGNPLSISYFSGGVSNLLVGIPVTVLTPFLFSFVKATSTSVTAGLNGDAVRLSATGSGISVVQLRTNIGGGDRTLENKWQGDIVEIIVVNDAVTSEVRIQTEGYLAHKWGLTANLPADHPYKNYPPRGL